MEIEYSWRDRVSKDAVAESQFKIQNRVRENDKLHG